jgi:hypothetical protein
MEQRNVAKSSKDGYGPKINIIVTTTTTTATTTIIIIIIIIMLKLNEGKIIPMLKYLSTIS